MSLDRARDLLGRAKIEYRRLLKQVDNELRRAVAQDPIHLDEARAIQSEYVTEFTRAPLKALEQPDAPVEGAAEPAAGPASQPVPQPESVPAAPVDDDEDA